MADVLNTTIKMTDQASSTLTTINQNLKKVISSLDIVVKTLNVNTQATIVNNDAIIAATRAMKNEKQASDQAKKSLEQHGNEATKAKDKFSLLGNSVQGLAKRLIAFQTLKTVASEVDNFANTQARLNAMNDGKQTTDELYKKIYQASQRARTSVADLSHTVAKLGIVARKAFSSNDELIAFTETFNKAAVVSGASESERANSMYQLSQALAAGRLQGDELRSVRENAPMVMAAIEKEIEAQFGKGADIQKLAREGLISADVIKRAVLKSAKDINTAFDKMPMTIGAFATQTLNKIRFVSQEIFSFIVKLINRPDVKNAINSVTNFASKAIFFVWGALKKLGNALVWLAGKWNYLKWVLYGFLIVMGIVKTATMLQATWNGILAAKTAILKFIEGVRTKGLWAQFAAMCAVNTTMLIAVAIIAAIIVVIALAIYYLEWVMATVYVVGAAIWNVVLGVYNFILSVIDALIDPFIEIAEFIYNCFNGGFTSWMDGVVNMFGKLVSSLMSIITPILEVWDMAFDTNAAGKWRNWQANVGDWGKNENAATFDKGLLKKSIGAGKDLRYGYGEAWNDGKAKGTEWKGNMKDGWNSIKSALGGGDQSVESMLGIPSDEALDAMAGKIGDPSSFGTGNADKLADALGDNTAALKDNTASNSKEDDYSLLRDVMAQRAVSRLGNSAGVAKIEIVNNNSLNSKLDIKQFLEMLAKKVEEAAMTSAQGVHN